MREPYELPVRGHRHAALYLLFVCAALCPGLALADARSAVLAGAPSSAPAPPASSTVRVYTNADLEALGTISTQAAPLVETPGWSFVFSVLDRERALEEKQKERELAWERSFQKAALEEVPASYPVLYSLGAGPFWCGGRGGSLTITGPSNPHLSLQVRGIRTSVDLFRESVRNAEQRRRAAPPPEFVDKVGVGSYSPRACPFTSTNAPRAEKRVR